jgi:hypothetical protein
MPLTGDVELSQGGVVVSARTLANASPVDVALVDGAGNQLTGFDASRPANTTLSSVAYAAGSQPVLAANAGRRGVVLYNATNKAINVALSATASLTAFSFQIPSLGTWESALDGYTGAISAIWTSAPAAGATLHVTELTT